MLKSGIRMVLKTVMWYCLPFARIFCRRCYWES